MSPVPATPGPTTLTLPYRVLHCPRLCPCLCPCLPSGMSLSPRRTVHSFPAKTLLRGAWFLSAVATSPYSQQEEVDRQRVRQGAGLWPKAGVAAAIQGRLKSPLFRKGSQKRRHAVPFRKQNANLLLCGVQGPLAAGIATSFQLQLPSFLFLFC